MKRILFLALMILAVPFLALADSVTLDWPVQVETANAPIVGFKFYQGQSSGVYAAPKDIGKVQTYTTVCPQQPLAYSCFFAISAYNGAGESGKSDEVSKAIPAAPVAAPSLTLAVVGDPATGTWNVTAVSNVAEPFDTQVYINGAFHHTDLASPRCAWRNGTDVCSGGLALKAPGSYVVEFRLVKAGLEVTRKSLTVVVPTSTPVKPTGLTVK